LETLFLFPGSCYFLAALSTLSQVVVRWAPLVAPLDAAAQSFGEMLTLTLQPGPTFHPDGELVLTEAPTPLRVVLSFVLQVHAAGLSNM
jgi:hypothetical protein